MKKLLYIVGGIVVAILITYSEIMRKGFYPVIVVSQGSWMISAPN